ncbi:MAG TPA: CHAT domain-containing protein [Blastocatellia bacterium]|nr:CHAT domain-containing protein [Blastocatellia bacterium]
MNQIIYRIRTRLGSLTAMVLAMLLLSGQTTAQETTTLEPGKPITRAAKASDVHTYSLTLTAGQFIRVTVEQNELDVSVDLIAPDNKSEHIVNATRFFGDESLSWEAATNGVYKIVIRTLFALEGGDTYQAALEVKPAATVQDKQRIAAEQGLTEVGRTAGSTLSLEQKQEKYQEALRIWRELQDRRAEACTHDVMALSYSRDRKYEQARETLKLALAIKEEISDHVGKIISLSNYGLYARVERNTSSNRNSEKSKQLMKLDEDYQQQALALSRELKHRGAERYILGSLTGTYRSQNLTEKTIAILEQILALDRERKNRTAEAYSLGYLGNEFQVAKRLQDALRNNEASLALFKELKDREGEAWVLRFLGSTNEALERDEAALQHHEAALSIYRELKDRRNEALSLRALGAVHGHASRLESALRYNEAALVVFRELKDQPSINSMIFLIANLSGRLKRYEYAQKYFDEYLAIFRTAKNRKGEADALFNFGFANYRWGRNEIALQLYDQALPIYLELKDRTGEGYIYREISNANCNMGRYDKGIEYTSKALKIWEDLNNLVEQEKSHNNLGVSYGFLHQLEKATTHLEKSIALSRQTGHSHLDGGTISNLALVYLQAGQYKKAQEYLEQALAHEDEHKNVHSDKLIRAEILTNLGTLFHRQGFHEKAIGYFDQALQFIRPTKARQPEAFVLIEMANALRSQGKLAQALQADQQALQFMREVKSLDGESSALRGVMQDLQAGNQLRLAVLFGKQAVNVIQGLRSNFSVLDQTFQHSFLKSKEDIYRDLADLLISQGRLPEAEQVIRLLKEEEFFDYIRRDSDNAVKGEKATLTPEEQAIEKRYREIADTLSDIGTQRGELLGKEARTAEEEQLLAKLEGDLTVAGQMFQKFLDGLATEMAKQKDGGATITKLRDAQGLMEDLRELGKGVVALYTLVGENKYRVILTTADFQRAYEYPIKAADLNRKILAFRTALQNPKLDPLPLAQELYQILVGPVAKDLRGMKAQMLMWSLDGVLRYVPVAALHDGEKYLVERFRNAVFTPVSNARFKDEPSRNWKALGLGVTRSFGANIPALPGVAEEMRGIINDGGTGKGVLPGTIKLDEQFTQEAMLAGLRQGNPVVHVASHFQFKPGNETDSALLLGDGQFLSLAQIKVMPQVFRGVELLTLSACNTATSGSGANGKEIEGFGALAQKQGAKAVVASLWPVADRSTKNLMQEFYRLRETKGTLTKAEAMRQAQIKLLRGELQVTGEALAAREIVHEADKTANLPPYKVDPKAPYAHPYYWAPFILIGNWK